MHTQLLNIGFRYKGNNIYVCEDITVELRDGHILIMPMEQEVTFDELEALLLEG